MGGIVTRTYIQSDEYQRKNGNDVRKFAMVGTPNQGSVLPYYIWEGGDPIGADTLTGNIGILKPSRYLYTHSLNKLYKSMYGRGVCKNIPVFGEEPTIFGIDNLIFKPSCNRKEVQDFVQSKVPGLRDLLPVYPDALKNSETDKFINYPVNTSLMSLNTNYDILTNGIDTQLFVGVEDPDSTLETLFVLPNHNDILFTDYGYPQYEYPTRSRGDGTVPETSIKLPGLPVYKDKTYDGGHGALPNAAAADLVSFITTLTQN